MEENEMTIRNRLWNNIHKFLAMQLPQPSNNFHKYSKGATIADFEVSSEPKISLKQPYSAYMLGFVNNQYVGEAGARNSDTGLEKYNFGIINRCIVQVASNFAVEFGGKVVVNL